MRKSRGTLSVAFLIIILLIVNNLKATVGAEVNNNMPGKVYASIERPHKTGELIVKYKDHVKIEALESTYKINNFTRKNLSKEAKVDLIQIPKNLTEEQSIELLKKDSRVEFVQPNYIYYSQSTNTIAKIPSLREEDHGNEQWGFKNDGQVVNGEIGTKGVDMNLEAAWKIASGKANGEEIVVGVLDTGIDINHPDLKNSIWVNTEEIPNNGIDDDGNGYIDDVNGWDFYNGDNSVFDPLEGDQHGTHVAGTIGAEKNGIGVIGAAPGVKIMPLKFIGAFGGDTMDAIKAIDYGKKKGVKIINCSWANNSYDEALKSAMASSGILFVVAAGNEGELIDAGGSYPSSYNLDNIISVTSVNNKGELSTFSNYGVKNVDIAAPGESIISTVPKKIKAPAGIKTNNTFYQGFGMEGISNYIESKTLMEKILASLGVNKGDGILLVQDDESDFALRDCLGSYQLPLKDLGYYNVKLKTVPFYDDGPSLTEMKKYKLVIWFTGESYDEPLSLRDEDNLIDYLNQGGKLFLSGEYLSESLQGTSFLKDYLGVKVLFREGMYQGIKGVAGSLFQDINKNESFFSKDLGFVVKGNSYALEVVSKGQVVFEYLPSNNYDNSYEYYDGTSMAAPHVTALAALIYSRGVKEPLEIKNTILSSYKPLPYLKDKILYGGIPDAYKALGGEAALYDYNNDEVIDIKDLAYVAQFYNTTLQSLDWDYRLDINPDGIIDIYDLVKISAKLP